MTWGSWTPHKFKLAVSGCPRNCAEATIKDFGVVCVDSGYELARGRQRRHQGAGHRPAVQGGHRGEVMEYCGAFMQLYREEAHYLERTAPWVERVGLAHIKARVVDDGTTCPYEPRAAASAAACWPARTATAAEGARRSRTPGQPGPAVLEGRRWPKR
jgi:NAD(P)H-nitrite reductase large subunit